MENLKTLKVYFSSWRFWKPFLAVLTGAVAGFLYYYFVGCMSGSCPITSNPIVSVLFGGLMGYFLISSPCSQGKC